MTIDENTGLWRGSNGLLFVSHELIDAIRAFPVKREVQHCGLQFWASSLDIYSECPACGINIKLRSFSGDSEFPDLFDALIEWLSQPGAKEVFERRNAEVLSDMS